MILYLNYIRIRKFCIGFVFETKMAKTLEKWMFLIKKRRAEKIAVGCKWPK